MAKFWRFEGTFSWFFIELETHSVERDICLIATAQRPNCFYNKGYIAYFYCTRVKRPYFHFWSKIWRHHRVPWPRFHIRCGSFGDSAINKGYIVYFYCACAKRANGHISAPDLRTFSVDFFHRKSKKSAIFLLPVCMAYWPRKRAMCWATHVDHFHQVWSWYDYPSLSYSLLVRIRYVTLWPLTFWPCTVVKHGWSCGQPLHQVWRSYAYPFLTYESWCPP